MLIKEIDELTIKLDIVIVSDDYNTTEDNLKHYSLVKEDANLGTEEECKEIIGNITHIIEEFGYTVLNETKSNKDGSNSLYFTFCKEDEFNTEEVTLIIRLRVSDHDLPMWSGDKRKQDAKNRQINNLKDYANNNKWLNSKLKDNDEIGVDFIYVRYENAVYTEWEDVYKKIRQKLQSFSNKHK